ncbi:MAG: M28 family peptidase [bacterium]|nr:M28 family peptidase [Candidatus Kapabacteria bacterium]
MLVLVALVVASSNLAAQSSDRTLPRDTVLARVRMHVLALASDSMAGRRPPTPGNAMAASYIARAFDRFGLVPLHRGERSIERFYESFNYLHGLERGRKNSLTVAGARVRDIDFVPLGFSDNASVSGPLVFAGYGITDSASNYDDYLGLDAKGAIAIIMRYSPEGEAAHGRFAEAMSWSVKVRNAIAHGVKGIIFLDPSDSSSQLPSLELNRGFMNTGLPSVFVRDKAITAGASTIRHPSGRDLYDLRRLIDSTRKPASFRIVGATASITTDVKRLEASVPNVIGLLPGVDAELRDEVIVIGAHFDHLGSGGEGSLHGDHAPAIHYGADDNASGTAGLLLLAEQFAREHNNRRTIMFAAFNAEEEGLLGSQAFVRNVALPDGLTMISMINLDMIGRLDSNKLQVHGTGTSPGFERMLDSLNPGMSLKYSKEGVGPSDHSSFYSKNIPVLAFFTGIHKDYHKPGDTWDKVNFDGATSIAGFVGDVVRSIDRADTAPMFTKADPAVTARRTSGFKVYVGTLPDYGYEGKGMRITGVSGGSPAEVAGLKDGDVIVKMGDYAIGNIYDYMDALSHFKFKQEVPTEVVRGAVPLVVTIVMGTR